MTPCSICGSPIEQRGSKWYHVHPYGTDYELDADHVANPQWLVHARLEGYDEESSPVAFEGGEWSLLDALYGLAEALNADGYAAVCYLLTYLEPWECVAFRVRTPKGIRMLTLCIRPRGQ